MKYEVIFVASAAADLAYLRAAERSVILHAIREQLTTAPLTETNSRKTLRPNSIAAPWELRIGRYRVFYEVEHEALVVRVLAVGRKTHNQLFIRGREVEL